MIEFDRVTIASGSFRLTDITFVVPGGAYAALVGRTGVGKTTLVEALCGLRAVESGTIRIDGRDVTRLPPAARGVGYVPQDVALFEHLRVCDNIGFALALRGATRAENRARVSELAELMHIEALLDRRVGGLSGGERQRVALARALAGRPSVLALDEPLSALDEATREQMCDALLDAHRVSGATVLHITHSLSEAERLAGRVFRLTADGFRNGP
ncbi:MAG: ATP-binding cassette domain-containing protein [Phycisphaerales bacterium]|nr:ATP-binding cassette domain-containing protein [Phycisphaerales bacterium]